MKTLLILGAGTGGTMVANKMVHELDSGELGGKTLQST